MKIFHLASNNIIASLVIRVGDGIVEYEYPDCQVGKGVQYVNQNLLVETIAKVYKYKAHNGIMHVSKTALFHITLYNLFNTQISVDIAGLVSLVVPNVIGISNVLRFALATLASALLTVALPLFIGTQFKYIAAAYIARCTKTSYLLGGLSLLGFAAVYKIGPENVVIPTHLVSAPLIH